MSGQKVTISRLLLGRIARNISLEIYTVGTHALVCLYCLKLATMRLHNSFWI